MAFRTKKISQMDPKGSNLASTDLLEISELVSGSYVTKSITGAEIVAGVGSGFVPTTRTLTINGTTQDLSANRTFTISTGITIGTTAITSGTVGRVLFEGTGNVVQESANLFWNNTNGRLGIGTSTPAGNIDINANFATTGYPLIVKNTGYFNAFFQGTSANNQASFYLENDRGSTHSYGGFAIGGSTSTLGNIFGLTRPDRLFMFADGAYNVGYAIGTLQNVPLQFGTNNAIRATVFGNGNIGINTTTDAGYRLDVNGTARVTQMTFPATIDKKIFLYQGVTDYAIGLAAGAIRLGTPAGNRVAMGNYTGATFTEICNVSPTGLNLLSGRVDLGADTSNVKLAIYTNTGVSMGLGVSASTFRFSAGGTTNNFVFFDDAAGNKLYSLISLTGAGYYGSGTVDASSQLQVDSTTRGFLPPRMTTTQKNAIASPATGLMVYDTTLNLISVYNGTTWISL
jgi:hypothetical protein